MKPIEKYSTNVQYAYLSTAAISNGVYYRTNGSFVASYVTQTHLYAHTV